MVQMEMSTDILVFIQINLGQMEQKKKYEKIRDVMKTIFMYVTCFDNNNYYGNITIALYFILIRTCF